MGERAWITRSWGGQAPLLPHSVVASEDTQHSESRGIAFSNSLSFLYAYELKVGAYQDESHQEKPKRETPSSGRHLQPKRP